ncbi:MAG: hypothetical protein HGA44_08225 [Cellulomonadaceae bacterium]|nr:hypothetical protein [Cellulomonadaceae bacterium]
MSTSTIFCVDCEALGLCVRVKPSTTRCSDHRAAYRRWYKAHWKAQKRGAASANRPYVPPVVVVDQAVLTPGMIDRLEAVASMLRLAARDLAALRGHASLQIERPRTAVANSSVQLDELISALKRVKTTR